jgi:hypothetical protein
MKYKHPVTLADRQSSAIELIRTHLKTSHVPVYVDSTPIPDAKTDGCFPTVDEYVRINGGARILGWSIWELPGV